MGSYDDDLLRTIRPAERASAVSTLAGERRRADGPMASGHEAVMKLQRSIGNAGVVQLLQSEDDPHGLAGLVGSGGGSALDGATKIQMEQSIGADFSDVRIHTGAEADQSAKSLGAHAYTSGSDVVFADGRYDPGSADGQRTLAHELTHVVQQRSGPVDGEMTDTGVKVSDPSDSFERAAEANAERVVGDPSPAPTPVGGGASGVQRHEDEQAVQAFADPAAVQREELPEEDEAAQRLADPAAAVQREGEEEELPE